MKRCACGNTDASMFVPFSVGIRSATVRHGWRCVKCSRFKLEAGE